MVNFAFHDIRKTNIIMSLIDKYAIHFDFYILGPLDCDFSNFIMPIGIYKNPFLPINHIARRPKLHI